MQQQQQQNNGITFRGAINLLFLLVSGHSTCFTVFTRHSFGVEALGVSGLAALALILFYICLTASPAMVVFGEVWFAALALQRIITQVRVRRGWIEHSRYEGRLWLGLMTPFVRRVEAAKICEMLFCLSGGVFLSGIDEPLGRFVLFGFFSLLGKAAIEREIERKRLQRMRDAEIEMRQLADRLHQRDF